MLHYENASQHVCSYRVGLGLRARRVCNKLTTREAAYTARVVERV